jgi:hypothetical protein
VAGAGGQAAASAGFPARVRGRVAVGGGFSRRALVWRRHRGECLETHGRAVRELCQKLELAAHGFDIAAQRRQQHVAALLQARDGLLLVAKLARQADLCALERAAQVAQGHFLGDQLSGASVDPGRRSAGTRASLS